MKMQSTIHGPVGCLFFSLSLLPIGQLGATSQTTPRPPVVEKERPLLPTIFNSVVSIDEDNEGLDGMLKEVLAARGISAIIDDEPLLRKSNLKFHGTLRDALDAITDTFDYTWSRSKSGVLILTKRFTNQDELPQINLPEMAEMTRDMIHALNEVDFDKDESHWPLVIKQVAQTFTREQTTALQNGSRLAGADLTGPQKELLQQAILSNTFLHPLIAWQGLLPKLEFMLGSRLYAQKQDRIDPGKNTPAYDFKYAYRAANGQLKVYDLPHIVFGHNSERITTP